MKKQCRTCLHNCYTVIFEEISTVYCSRNQQYQREYDICPWWHMESWLVCDGCACIVDGDELACGLTGKDPIAYCGRKCDMSQM